MIWRCWPVSGLWAVSILLGVKMVVAGMAMMALEPVDDADNRQSKKKVRKKGQKKGQDTHVLKSREC
jgi:hypothetical protein